MFVFLSYFENNYNNDHKNNKIHKNNHNVFKKTF